jgi:hypothetical protein
MRLLAGIVGCMALAFGCRGASSASDMSSAEDGGPRADRPLGAQPIPATGRVDSDGSMELSLPERIDGVTSVPPGYRVVVPGGVHIVAAGRLELAPGDELAFAKGAGLFVEGGALVARGSEREPVVLRSASASPQPGDWIGVVFDSSASASVDARGDASPEPASSMDHVMVRDAGGARPSGEGAAISVEGCLPTSIAAAAAHSGAPVSLRDVALRDNANRGLNAPSACAVQCTGLVFGKNGGSSARIATELAPQLGEAPTETVELTGPVLRSVSLPRPSAPYLVADRLQVGSLPSRAVLTFAEGTVVRFARGSGILVGGQLGAGGLVAHGVTFTTAQSPPVAGAWGSIHFLADATGDLERDIFEYGGKGGPVVIAAPNPGTEGSLHIHASAFRHNSGTALGAARSCRPWLAPSSGNEVDGTPACVVVR